MAPWLSPLSWAQLSVATLVLLFPGLWGLGNNAGICIGTQQWLTKQDFVKVLDHEPAGVIGGP